MSNLEHYLKLADSKSLNVLYWLLNNRESDNRIITTLEVVAEKCGVTKVTVNRVFQKLYAEGYLSKLRNGQYQLHKV
ncbi:MAG: helix-turn-helix domain-containing protein [Gammaproteobacteria bacterium]|nr:helix-turn-helix domain-containing protein [Gammaproteobacteria bacterium]